MVLSYSVGVGLTALATPLAVQSLVNTVAFGVLVQPLIVISLLLLGALVLNAVMRAAKHIVVERLQQRLFVRGALALSAHLGTVDRTSIDAATVHQKTIRFLDMVTVQKAAATFMLDGISLGLQSSIGLVLLAFYHPALFGLALTIFLGVVVIVVVLGRGGKETSIDESKEKYRVVDWMLTMAEQRRAFNGSARTFAQRRASELIAGYAQKREKHFTVLLRQIVGSLALETIAVVLLLAVGGWLVIDKQLTLGQLVAAELIVTPVVSGLTKLGKQLESYYDWVASDHKLHELFAIPSEDSYGAALPDGASTATTAPAIQLADVSAQDGEIPVLDGVALTLAFGEVVSITGASGSGKSLLVDLIAGDREPSAGTILFRGVDLRDLARSEYRDAVAVVAEVELFDGTILDNVLVGRETISPDRARRALALAGLTSAIDRLPRGAHTKLGPSGFSANRTFGLQLMFARALVGNPRVLLVDGVMEQVEPSLRKTFTESLQREAKAGSAVLVFTTDAQLAGAGTKRYELRDNRLSEVS